MSERKPLWPGLLSILLLSVSGLGADLTNHPPEVRIVSPPNGAVFLEPSDLMILAAAKDADGIVQTVEFFADGNSLGTVPRPPAMLEADATLEGMINLAGALNTELMADVFLDFIPINPFHITWRDVPAGRHVLTAVATDNLGAATESSPVEITVLDHALPPIVTVVATDPGASEADSNTGTFTIHRTGPTNSALVVSYLLSGTASNGVDYAELPLAVTVPAGKRTADVVVMPKDDALVEGPETVVLKLGPPPCPDPTSSSDACYLIGRYDRAVVIIRDNDRTNRAPVVRILNPQSGEMFRAGSNVRISAAAWDFDGAVKSVEFFEGDNSLGIVTVPAPDIAWDDDPTFRPIVGLPLYSITWSNVAVGEYVLTAVATDDQEASTVSGPIKINVVELRPPPIVTIKATDPDASEPNPLSASAVLDTATFTVYRDRGTNTPLTVYYRIGGTAKSGADYRPLSGTLTIPEGAWSADIVVDPIDDDLVEGTESVLLTLLPGYPPCLFSEPPCEIPVPAVPAYYVGFPGEAVSFIHDNEQANQRAKVEIVKPQTGATFAPSSDIEIDVRAQDPDGWVHTVEFYANGVKIGEQSIEFIQAPPPNLEQMFSLVWSNVTAGRYILTARAIDDRGAASTSGPVTIVVGDEPPLVPVISITAPDPFAAETVSATRTNTALFKIFRTGPTNLDLTVFFSVHGTASNGVDYAEIGNSATIPAGRRSARVEIVPLDDDLVENIETVILKLEPDPTLGPMALYDIGRPDRAAAVIVDNDWLNPPCHRLPDGSFHLCLERPDGFAFRLDASEDLSAWVTLCTNVVTDGALHFVDPEAQQHSHRYYRIVPQSNYAPEE